MIEMRLSTDPREHDDLEGLRSNRKVFLRVR